MRATKVSARAKTAASRKTSRKAKRATKKRGRPPVPEIRSAESSTLEGGIFRTTRLEGLQRGMGAGSAGQSGDVQGLSRKQDIDSESVEELLEEGQSREAEIVSGVENALDPDQGEVQTREVLADDVPEEYIDED